MSSYETPDGKFSIFYEVQGEEKERSVILGHGLLEGLTPWRTIAKNLASDYRVIIIQARGHGKSTAPEGFTVEDLASDWLGVMNKNCYQARRSLWPFYGGHNGAPSST